MKDEVPTSVFDPSPLPSSDVASRSFVVDAHAQSAIEVASVATKRDFDPRDCERLKLCIVPAF
jgi:hypothetical protein